jgi:hypothetical protein
MRLRQWRESGDSSRAEDIVLQIVQGIPEDLMFREISQFDLGNPI